MDTLTINDVITLISVAAAVCAIAYGALSHKNGQNDKVSKDGEWRGKVDSKLDLLPSIQKDLTTLKTDLSHTIDKLDEKTDRLSERVTIVEQSTKSAHKRLDGIESKVSK